MEKRYVFDGKPQWQPGLKELAGKLGPSVRRMMADESSAERISEAMNEWVRAGEESDRLKFQAIDPGSVPLPPSKLSFGESGEPLELAERPRRTRKPNARRRTRSGSGRKRRTSVSGTASRTTEGSTE